MADIDLKTETPDTSLPSTGFLFGADSQAASAPSVFTTQAVATTLLGSTTLSGATITADAPVLNLAQTWNNAAVTFTGLKFNVPTDSSAAASLLMDLQVGGSSKFKVRKDGSLILAQGNYIKESDANNIAFYRTDNNLMGRIDVNGSLIINALIVGIANGDTVLTRRAAANLRLGASDVAAPVAQTLSVQSVVAGTTNTAGANLTITGSQGTGTGAGGSIVFQVAPAGSSGTAQNALATALTINSARQMIVADGTNALPFLANSTDSSSGLYWGGPYQLVVSLGSSKVAAFGLTNFTVNSAGSLQFGSSSIDAPDTRLWRDAANTLALRNGANAQTFRVYDTYTDTSNYRRITLADGLFWEVGGTGASSAGLNIYNRDNGPIYFATNNQIRWTISASGHFLAQADNTYDIGASGANRPRNVYVAGTGTFGLVEAPTYYANAGTRMRLGETNGNVRFHNAVDNNFGLMIFGNATSSFPALKRSSAILQARLADDSAFAGFASANMQAATAYTVATLPGTPGTGMIARVTDALAPTIGATVTGGGAAYALVNYNGANWTVIGV